MYKSKEEIIKEIKENNKKIVNLVDSEEKAEKLAHEISKGKTGSVLFTLGIIGTGIGAISLAFTVGTANIILLMSLGVYYLAEAGSNLYKKRKCESIDSMIDEILTTNKSLERELKQKENKKPKEVQKEMTTKELLEECKKAREELLADNVKEAPKVYTLK